MTANTDAQAVAIEQLRLIADRAELIAIDAAKDPDCYSDPAEGWRWAAEQIRAAIKEVE